MLPASAAPQVGKRSSPPCRLNAPCSKKPCGAGRRRRGRAAPATIGFRSQAPCAPDVSRNLRKGHAAMSRYAGRRSGPSREAWRPRPPEARRQARKAAAPREVRRNGSGRLAVPLLEKRPPAPRLSRPGA
jgi:hypothetical protein